MKRFAIALTALAATCTANSVMAQATVADQMRALRERRTGAAAKTGEAPAAAEQAQREGAGGAAESGKASVSTQIRALREQELRDRAEESEALSKRRGALAKARNCLACHEADKKLVGPAYKDIAAKYSADDVDKLVGSILNGSTGNWGSVPMRPNKRVSDEEARTLATWILEMK